MSLQPILSSATGSKVISSTWTSFGWIYLPYYGVGAGRQKLGLCCWALCCSTVLLVAACSSSQSGWLSGSHVSHFLEYTFTCCYCLTPSSFPPPWKTIPPQQLVLQAPALDLDTTDDISSFITVIVMRLMRDLKSVSELVDVCVNIDRSAKLILKPLKTEYFLISIQVFLVLQLQLSWTNSLNTRKDLYDWYSDAPRQNRTLGNMLYAASTMGMRQPALLLLVSWSWGRGVTSETEKEVTVTRRYLSFRGGHTGLDRPATLMTLLRKRAPHNCACKQQLGKTEP